MIDSFIKQKKSIIYGTIVLIIFLIIIYSPTLFKGDVFAWYNDHLFQHNYYYREWHRIINQCIENHNLGFYSWNTFLGADFLTSKLMYCVGDFILTPLFIVWRGEINYDVVLCIETIICFVLSYINFVLFLDKFGIKSKSIIFGLSLVYSLSGFTMMMSGSYMFHRFYALLPLFLFSIEEYRTNGKATLFSILTALLFLQNYELFFTISLFTILYFIFTFKLHNETKISKILIKSIRLIVAYCVGLMLAGFALVPILLFINNNTRVGTMDFGPLLWPFRVYIGFISNLFFPAINYRTNQPNYLFYSDSHFGSEYGIYSTPLIFIALIHLFKKGTDHEKKCFSIFITVLLAFVLFRPLNMVAHGFSEPSLRWSFLIIVMSLITCAYVFDKYEYDRRYIKESAIIFISYVILLVMFSLLCRESIINKATSYCLLIIGGASIFIFDYLLYKKDKSLNVFLVIILSVLYTCSIYPSWLQYEDGDYINTKELKYNMENNGDKLSRIYISPNDLRPFNELNLNASMKYDYLTTTTYDSTFDYTLKPFLSANNYDGWIIDINKPGLLKMLGTKYLLVGTNKDILNEFETEHIFNLDEIEVYRINNSNNIGHTYSSFTKSLSEIKDWNEQMYIDDNIDVSDIKSSEKQQLKIIDYNNQYMKATIDVPSKQVLMITIPYSTGWNIYDQNGTKLNQFKVQGGFLGLMVDENIKEISIFYQTPGLKTGLVLSGMGLLGIVVLFIYDRSNRKRKKAI